MTDEEGKVVLGKIVWDNESQERKKWASFLQTCCRSLIVFLCQLFVIVVNNFVGFWETHLSKTCDESTASIVILCSTAT